MDQRNHHDDISGAIERENEEEITYLLAQLPEHLDSAETWMAFLFAALRSSKPVSFSLLIGEIKKRRLPCFLNDTDSEGNTLLQVAIGNQLLEAVELLLTDTGIAVNSSNNINGETATDIYYSLQPNSVTRRIGQALFEPRTRVAPTAPITRSKSTLANSLETKNILLVVMVLVAGATLSAASNPPAMMIQVHEKFVDGAAAAAFHVSDVLMGRVPASFYFLVANTAAFAASLGAIATVVWCLPCAALTLFVVFMVFVLYMMLVDKAMPRISVKIGSWTITSSVLVWVSSLFVICFGVTVVALVKYVWSRLYMIGKRLQAKMTGIYRARNSSSGGVCLSDFC